MRYLLPLLVLASILYGCTVGEAVLGAGAAGTVGYLLGEHSNDNKPPSHYYRCERGSRYDRCY